MQTVLYQVSFLPPQLAMPPFRSAVFIYLSDSRFRNSCACSINNDSVSLCTHLVHTGRGEYISGGAPWAVIYGRF